MENFNSIEHLSKSIKTKLDSPITKNKKKVIVVYAFNSTGKTRLANILSKTNNSDETEDDAIKVLCYNAFLEDMFKWNNENYTLFFDKNSWIIKLVIDQGLEGRIIDNFNAIVGSNIEPSFDFIEGVITFNIVSGDDSSVSGIKVSRGEESIFIWSIFYTILETAIDALNADESDRTTTVFNDLKYMIIDDPVSSIDDTKIILMAIKLVETIDLLQNNTLKFFITTHHALFYNVLVNSFKRKGASYKFKSYSLSKDNQTFELTDQNDSPFAYHLSIKKIIQNAIVNNDIEKYHFNLFRNLLEKTSNFLGYNNWTDCIPEKNKEEFARLLNLYSHNRLSDLEGKELSNSDKDLFRETFNNFIQTFKWN